jgi:hypothetical protein
MSVARRQIGPSGGRLSLAAAACHQDDEFGLSVNFRLLAARAEINRDNQRCQLSVRLKGAHFFL